MKLYGRKIFRRPISGNIFRMNFHGGPSKIGCRNIIGCLLRHFAEQTKWPPVQEIREK